MKFSTPFGKIDNAEINNDFEMSTKYDTLKVGKTGVFYKSDFVTKYLPYDYLERVFIRIHEVNGKLCCGSTVFQYFRMVFVHDGKEFADVISENEKAMNEALDEIAKYAVNTKIGYNT